MQVITIQTEDLGKLTETRLLSVTHPAPSPPSLDFGREKRWDLHTPSLSVCTGKTHISLPLEEIRGWYTSPLAGIQVTLKHPPTNFSKPQRCNKLPAAYNALKNAPPLPSLHEDFQWHWIHHLQDYYFIKKQIKCLINSAVIEIMESASRPHLRRQVMKHFQAARKRKLIEARGNNHFYAISSGDSGPSNLYWSPLTCHSALTRASFALTICLDI